MLSRRNPQLNANGELVHLLSIEGLPREVLVHILDTAGTFLSVNEREVKKVPLLRGKSMFNLFFENSTRTRTTFEIAAKRLSADVFNLDIARSSTAKGESLLDTIANLSAMHADLFVVRHGESGAPYLIAKACAPHVHVVNAGDGRHEHPTQGLLDIFTIRQVKGRIAGLKVAIVGDVANSRVARSNLHGLLKLGAEVTFVGPTTLVPRAFERMGAKIAHDFDKVIGQFDVINMLRIQSERISSNVFPSLQEYSRLFGLSSERMKRARPDVLVMHPGPINRGIEMSAAVADGANSAILRQVTNGLAIRMAVMFLCKQAADGAA